MIRRTPVYPFLFAAFPIFFLYGLNVEAGVSPGELVVPLVVAMVGVGLVALVFWAAFRHAHRAALGASAVVLLVFSFGHVENAIDPIHSGRTETLLLVGWALLLLAAILALAHPRDGFQKATEVLNIVAIFLVLINVVPIMRFETSAAKERLPPVTTVLHPDPDEPRRDIYYLIFDRYAADRTLREVYDFDNGPFLRRLEEIGFYVADESVANYQRTTHSLASSLNMTYLDDLARDLGPDSGDWDPLLDALSGSRVPRALQQIGYRYEHVGSWWAPTATDPSADDNFVYGAPSTFGRLLYGSTALPALAERLGLQDRTSFELEQHARVRFQFESILQIAKDPAPTFTFAHFTLPHPPYVFHADGSFADPAETGARARSEAYLDQLIYTNEVIEDLVEGILSDPSASDPIIVLQSDEGPHPARYELDEGTFDWTEASDAELGEKLRILNAYFLPGLDDAGLYPTISPINTFRLIFDKYFQANLPLLEDRTFVYQDDAHPYRFSEVTERLQA